MNLKGNEITKKGRRKKEHLHYTTPKERNPSYCSPSPCLRAINAIFISVGRITKARRSHASKIDTWADQKAATVPEETRQYLGPLPRILVMWFVWLLAPSVCICFCNIWTYISPDTASNSRTQGVLLEKF